MAVSSWCTARHIVQHGSMRNADWFDKIQDCIRSQIATSLKPPIPPLARWCPSDYLPIYGCWSQQRAENLLVMTPIRLQNTEAALDQGTLGRHKESSSSSKCLRWLFPGNFFKSSTGVIIATLAQTFLCFWGIWGMFVYFLSSLWWQFLNPFNLGLDLYAIMVIFCFALGFALLPCVMNCVNCCNGGENPSTKFATLSWIFLGPVPAVLTFFTLINHAKARTLLSMLALFFGLLGQVAMLVAPIETAQGRV